MKRFGYLLFLLLSSTIVHAQLSVVASDTIADEGTQISMTASGSDFYTWTASAGVSLDTNEGSSVNTTPPVGSHTVTVVGIDTSLNDTDTVVVNILINNAPVSVMASDTSACDGESVSIVSSGFDVYDWTASNGLTIDTMAGDSVNVTATTGSYTVTLIAYDTILADTDTATINIVFNVNPTIILNSTADGDNGFVCLGNSATITAITDTGLFASISWTPAATLNNDSETVVIATPDTLITYSATITNDYGCQITGTKTLNVGTVYPEFGLTYSPSIICPGDTATFTAIPTSGGTTFSWSPSTRLTFPTGITVDAFPLVTTTYTLTGTRFGCSTDTAFTYNVYSPPSMSATQSSNGSPIKLDEADIVTVTCPTCVSYLWKLPNSTLQTSLNAQSISPTSPGSFVIKIVGTDSNTCRSSVSVIVMVDSAWAGEPWPPLGVEEINAEEILISQNASYLKVNSGSNLQQISLFNLLGEMVDQRLLAGTTTAEFAIENLASGIYVLAVKSEESSISKKIYIQ